MCERNIDWLPLACPQPWAWPATQACAQTGNQTCDLLGLQVSAKPIEPHQPGLFLKFLLFTVGKKISFVFFFLFETYWKFHLA